ncbi:MAG: response regulator transcription factor [Thermoguttaceae bacterium]
MEFEPTVFVVDDDERARKSVCALVRSLGLRAEAFPSAEEFLARCTPGRPGCVVTDVRMVGMSGLDLQDKLIERGIRLPVIVLTAYPRTSSTVRAIKAGAVTLLEKPYDEEELWDAIRKALAQEAAGRAKTQRRSEIQERAAGLTPAERTVMNLIVQGQPNKIVAKQLNLSIRTVESRRHEVFTKMGVQSVAELVRLAIEGELVP